MSQTEDRAIEACFALKNMVNNINLIFTSERTGISKENILEYIQFSSLPTENEVKKIEDVYGSPYDR